MNGNERCHTTNAPQKYPRHSRKQPECLQLLLSSAADPNVQNNAGLTPLLIAVDHPDFDSIQYLIVNNADVSLKVGKEKWITFLEKKVSIKSAQKLL